MEKGKILVFSAPSGSGKTTLVRYIMSVVPNLHFSISATSRNPRSTEKNGVDYYFISPSDFRDRIARNEFLEYEEVYPDKFYGTLRSQVEKQLEAGENVVLDIDVKGAVNVKRIYGEQALLVFVQPPSIQTLRQRLVARGTDTEETINSRISKAEYEISFARQFDKIIINDILENAQREALQTVTDFLKDKQHC